MRFYEKKILPYLIDSFCSSSPTTKQRQKIIPKASGDILEIGLGSGLNLEFYNPSKVNKIWGLEPSIEMQALAKKAQTKTKLKVNFLTMPAEALTLEANSIDTIVLTYVLCTIPDVDKALLQMHRVLKPEGRILFSEHGLAPDKNVQCMQNVINPLWKKVSGGCHLNRNIPLLLRNAAFQLQEDNRMYIPGFRFAAYNFWGIATK